MDKIVRNVIIFAAIILVVAAAFTIFMVARKNPANTNTDVNGNAVANGNTIGTNTVETPTGEFQDVKLSVSGSNYILTPSTLKKGVPVRMTADLATLKGCSRDVVISAFSIRKYVKDGDNVITFTPTQTGIIKIACSMNMYRGTFTVVDVATDSATTNTQGVPSSTTIQDNTQTALSGSENTDTAPTHTCGMAGSGGCGGSCGASAGGCGCGG